MSVTGGLFLLAFCAGCIFAFTRHPIWGVATYIGTFFLSPQLRWWGQSPFFAEMRWAYVAALATGLALLLSKRAKRPAIPLLGHGVVWALLLFVVWLVVQSAWALDPDSQSELLSYYVKFAVALGLIYYSVDAEWSLKVLLWTHVAGCFYFGWIAYTSYTGGRFEGFGGAGINEANAGALTVVTGIFAASSLFLAGKLRTKLTVFGMIPFIVNALVTTISRSGFLALASGGLAFNWFTPKKHAKAVRVLSVLAVALFLMLTGPSYWKRMQSMEHAGEQVAGVNTGEDRIAIVKAQWRMFLAYPLGCGAMCTAVLSPRYLEQKYLAAVAPGANVYERASHNTIMSMLVEHGIPGILFYCVVLIWTAKALVRLARKYDSDPGGMPTLFPSVAAIMVAITVGDLFVSYMKFEIRLWFIAVLMAMLNMAAQSPALDEQLRGSGMTQERGRARREAVGTAL